MPQTTISPAPRAGSTRRRGSARTKGSRASANDQTRRQEPRFSYRCGIYDLIVPVEPRRSKTVLREEAEFALIVEEPVVLLAYRFGGSGDWNSARFTWLDLPRPDQTPPLDSDDRALLAIRLIAPDAEGDPDGEGPSRNLTLTLDFTRALNDAVRELARYGPDPRAETRALAALHRRYPTARDVLPRAVARSVGVP
jgi:hypothetical protein